MGDFRRLRVGAGAGLAAAVLAISLAGPAGTLLAAPAPAARAAETPDPRPMFGYNEAWTTGSAMIDRAARGGATVARVVVSWRLVEPQSGAWSWAGYDQLYKQLRAAGKRPLWVLADAPCWARSERTNRCGSRDIVAYPPDPGHDSDWADFATAVAQRYPQAAGIEVWNEPNLNDFYKPAPDPERLAELAAIAGRAVDAVAPEMPVVLSGLSPITETAHGKRIAYDEFLHDVYRAAGSPRWDAVAMHPFPAFNAGGDFVRDVRWRLKRVREVLAEVGAAGTPIWVTEIGISTAGPHPFSPRRQAGGLVKLYRQLARMPDVPAIVVHRLVDQPTATTAEAGWGVLRANGDPKPAFCALAAERGGSC